MARIPNQQPDELSAQFALNRIEVIMRQHGHELQQSDLTFFGALIKIAEFVEWLDRKVPVEVRGPVADRLMS